MKRDDVLHDRRRADVRRRVSRRSGTAWGWTTAILGCGLMLLVIWLQNRDK